jgi:transposase
MGRSADSILLAQSEAKILAGWARSRTLSARLVQRAKIIQMAASGVRNKEIARELGISQPTIQLWRQRFLALRLPGLEKDAPRPGRIPRISDKKIRQIVEATLHSKPVNTTHWSTRLMAQAQGVSEATIRRIWKQHNLKPHLAKNFKLSRDKGFVEKFYDIAGLYLNPPDKSLVLCMGKKSQFQTLDGRQPGLPMGKGRCGTLTFDHKQNGATTLSAALATIDGEVPGDRRPRHRHQEFIRFLKTIHLETPPELDLHVIVDNDGTHKHSRVKFWLKRHTRFHIHVIPNSSSWLNLVEQWFREVTQERLRRESFSSVPDLVAAIYEYLDIHNQKPQAFVWSAPLERTLMKLPNATMS